LPIVRYAESPLPIADVLAVLRQVEARGRHETAHKIRATIGAVFRYAVATARADADPTSALKGALTRPTVKPQAAITDQKGFAALLRSVWGYDGAPETNCALKLMALLFPRPGELRQAEWPEFNLKEAVWVIPPPRMKMRRAHRVPLPTQAVEVLRSLHGLTGRGKYVFPSVRSASRCMSENTLNAALRRMGFPADQATAHGFRASFSTMANESRLWHPDAIERALAHVEGNDVRRAYARGEHWDERVRMATWWARHCDILRRDGR
jgi:integrase